MKLVIITGAGSGIGEASAQKFSIEGYEVLLIGRRLSALRDVAAKLKGPAECLSLDVGATESEHLLKDHLKLLNKPVFALINNAGIFVRKSFAETSDEEWNALFQTNMMGAARVTRATIPWLNGGTSSLSPCIINVSSTLGQRAIANTLAYSASKAAMNNWTKGLALEMAPRIRVNCVCPGVVDTPIHGFHTTTGLPPVEVANNLKIKEEISRQHPMGRMGTSQEIAEAIFFLSQSPWTTGTVIDVDGGINL